MLTSIIILIAIQNVAITIEGPPHIFPQLPRTGKILIARPPAFSPYALDKLKTIVVNAFDKEDDTRDIRPSQDLLQRNILTKIDGNTRGYVVIHTVPQRTASKGFNLSGHLPHLEDERNNQMEEAIEGINDQIFNSSASESNVTIDDSKQNTDHIAPFTTISPNADGEETNERRTDTMQSVSDHPLEAEISTTEANDNRQIGIAIGHPTQLNDKDMKVTNELSKITSNLEDRDFNEMNVHSRSKSLSNLIAPNSENGNENLDSDSESLKQMDKINNDGVFVHQRAINNTNLSKSSSYATKDIKRITAFRSEKFDNFKEENNFAISNIQTTNITQDEHSMKENKEYSIDHHFDELKTNLEISKESSEIITNNQRNDQIEWNIETKPIHLNGTEITNLDNMQQQVLLLAASEIPLTTCNLSQPFERDCHYNENENAIECVERFRNFSCLLSKLQHSCVEENHYSIDICRKFRIIAGRIHDLIEFPCRQVDLSTLMKVGNVNETQNPETQMEITWREPLEDIHNGLLRKYDDRLEWEPEEDDKKIVLSKTLEVKQTNRIANANDKIDTQSNIDSETTTKRFSNWKPFEMDCNAERDEFTAKCRYWALAGYCTNNKATKFLWCRKTCLCVGPPF